MGRIEVGETPEQGAMREMSEESGLKPLNLKKIGIIHPANGAVKTTMHIFLCTEFEAAERHLDSGEQGLEQKWIPLETWNRMIKDNQITDGDTLSAWAIYLCQNA